MSKETQNLGTAPERECDRCGKELGALQPATVISFDGAVQLDSVIICNDCLEPVVYWWNDGEEVE